MFGKFFCLVFKVIRYKFWILITESKNGRRLDTNEWSLFINQTGK